MIARKNMKEKRKKIKTVKGRKGKKTNMIVSEIKRWKYENTRI